MAFEPGGTADKLGNRYEGRWVAKQLLRLLNEEITSVTVEPIGPDEHGVDLLVVKKDGTRQLQQCKARLGNRESWSVATLKEKGILAHLKNHLVREPQQEFALVSPIPFQCLNDICESSRNSNDNPKDFVQYQIQGIGKKRDTLFHGFCEALGFDPDREEDLKGVFSYLKRTYIVLFPDDCNSLSNLLTLTGFLLTGEPESTLSVLLTFIENEDRFRKPIYSGEFRQLLADKYKIHPKQLEHDQRIVPAVERLQGVFSESIQPRLIGGTIISREETSRIIESVDCGRDVVVHGAAGYGKSGVLYEFTEYLRKQNIPYLPVRLDRRIPDKNAKKFGEDMGLPESPAFSLAGLAAGRKSVLILDQLDAIRWTAAHSTAAMDVCKELARQVRSLRKAGKNISIVFACRTFDLENDPEIKNLLGVSDNQEFAQIPIKEFSDEQMRKIVGLDLSTLTGPQKRILSCPQNLAMWIQLKQGGEIPNFCSATELMRRFWENKRQILEEKVRISKSELDAFLRPLLDYMESNGEVSAPASIAMQDPHIEKALISYGILQLDQHRICFCHQRYLDYLIAERLLLRIFEGTGSVLEWLGPKEKQSLFRREQLRQVLALLTDESPTDFFETVKEILESGGVRFHLKHLVLELIGQLDIISEQVGQYCLSLANDSYWREHVLGTVFMGHHSWVIYLLNSGVVSEWLSSKENDRVILALRLLSSVAEHIPDPVTEVLAPFVNMGDDWPDLVLNAICRWESDDSDNMFELRLQLIRKGYVKDFVDWKSLCTKYPLRAVRLIATVVSTWHIDDEDTLRHRKGRLESWYDQDMKALYSAVEKHPVQTWDLLMPEVERLTSIQAERYEPRLQKWQEKFFDSKETDIARGVIELLIIAGQVLAKEHSDELITRTELLEGCISPLVQRIVIAVFADLPPSYGDIGIGWLLANPERFRIGSGQGEPEWMPAARLIEALSPHCSGKLFLQLEESIIHYHSPKEKEEAEYQLAKRREGYFCHYWGQTQYFLLPALDAKRIRPATSDLIRELKRKFGHYPKEKFLRCFTSFGGWEGSKLEPNLERISDRAWLNIVSSNKVTERDNRKQIQAGPDRILSTSIRQFSGSLSRIAKRFPERFGQLALQFPEDVHPSYVSAILDGSGNKQPGEEVPESEKGSWRPSRVETIEAVLKKYQADDYREAAMSFCWLIANRADENWSDRTIARLVNYACNHPDLRNGELNVYCDKSSEEATVEVLFQNTINCVRGVAAGAIGDLLWKGKDRLDKVRSGIESLIRDPHPVVRMASIKAIEPVLNIDGDLAVRWFCEACKDDLRVAASPLALRFFNYTVLSHFDRVGPIIQQMVDSPLDEVAQRGASQVTARWFFHGFFETEFTKCCKGTVSQRKGVAEVSSSFLEDKKYAGKCQELLFQFMNDPDREVRDELRGLFRKKELLNDQQYGPFIGKYIESPAFADDPDYFVLSLKEFPGSLISVAEAIFAVCEEFSVTLKKKTLDIGSRYPHTVSEAQSILLRLYEQAQGEPNPQIADRCLDIWDLFFEKRVGSTIELTKAIER